MNQVRQGDRFGIVQEDVNGITFCVWVTPAPTLPLSDLDGMLLHEMRLAVEEAIEKYYEPNVCERCGKPYIPLAVMMDRVKRRRFVCPPCYPAWIGEHVDAQAEIRE